MKKVMHALPHVIIIISGMIFVLLIIDGVNSAMNFINNPQTKALMYILCTLSFLQSLFMASAFRRAERKKLKKKLKKTENKTAN